VPPNRKCSTSSTSPRPGLFIIVSRFIPGALFRTPLGLQNMTIYYDAGKKQFHGMRSVWDEKTQGWREYHDIAKITRE
jgi:hypothetical protein